MGDAGRSNSNRLLLEYHPLITVHDSRDGSDDLCAEKKFNAMFFKLLELFLEELLNILQKLCEIIVKDDVKNSLKIMLTQARTLQRMATTLHYESEVGSYLNQSIPLLEKIEKEVKQSQTFTEDVKTLRNKTKDELVYLLKQLKKESCLDQFLEYWPVSISYF
uniref:Uncharacterized protein n=1 Tax=Trichobilharzia regenti TaxID=157069 RepID=A0AA85K8G9_TRIRE|nr:unnamed protein product [Trichobilharzia regenti]